MSDIRMVCVVWCCSSDRRWSVSTSSEREKARWMDWKLLHHFSSSFAFTHFDSFNITRHPSSMEVQKLKSNLIDFRLIFSCVNWLPCHKTKYDTFGRGKEERTRVALIRKLRSLRFFPLSPPPWHVKRFMWVVNPRQEKTCRIRNSKKQSSEWEKWKAIRKRLRERKVDEALKIGELFTYIAFSTNVASPCFLLRTPSKHNWIPNAAAKHANL